MPNNSVIQAVRGFEELLVDPLFDKVVFLMDMASTALVDVRGHPLTAVNGAVINSDVPGPFSPYSLATNNVGFVTTSDSEDWTLSNGDFTYEAWIRPSASVNPQYFLAQAAWADWDGSVDFLLYGLTPGSNSHADGANIGTLTASSALPLNQWTHVAYERFGGSFTIYVGGRTSATVNNAGTTAIQNSTKPLVVGASSNSIHVFQGRIGPARITKGVARYKGEFVPMNFPRQ